MSLIEGGRGDAAVTAVGAAKSFRMAEAGAGWSISMASGFAPFLPSSTALASGLTLLTTSGRGTLVIESPSVSSVPLGQVG